MEALQQSTVANLLLQYCEPRDFDILRPHLRRRNLPTHTVVVRPNEPIEHVYFPEGGVVSIVADEGGDKVEVGLVGYDGMSGTAVLLDAGQSPQARWSRSTAFPRWRWRPNSWCGRATPAQRSANCFCVSFSR